jgi:serine/threonine protein phosphatase 1
MWNKWSLRARGGGMSLTYAIADLHGRFDLLTAAFDAIVKHAAERSFKIITLGNYVDRGPQSRQIIDHLMAAQEMGVSLICLKGNHEDMMVETLRKPLHPNWWIDNGGGQTLISYGHERSGKTISSGWKISR